jgi:pilus assembly protein CpaB
MVLAVVISAGVFVSVVRYVSSVSSQVGNQTTVYRAKAAVDAYTELSGTNLEAVQVPERWTSPASRLQLRQIEGRRAGFRIEPGTVISSDMLIPASGLSKTEREIAISVDAVTGLVGRIRPGDNVDVWAVFSDVPGLPKQVHVLARNVRVISISGQQTVSTADAQGLKDAKVVPLTLALEPDAAKSVVFATAFGQVRLVGLPTDVGVSRLREGDTFDAGQLGGKPVAEGE